MSIAFVWSRMFIFRVIGPIFYWTNFADLTGIFLLTFSDNGSKFTSLVLKNRAPC